MSQPIPDWMHQAALAAGYGSTPSPVVPAATPPVSALEAIGLGGVADKFDVRKLAAHPPAPTMMDGGNSASIPGAAPIQVPGVEPSPSLPPAGPPPPPTAQPVGYHPAAQEQQQDEEMSPQVQFRRIPGGASSGGEVHTRGPQQESMLMAGEDAKLGATNNIEHRSHLQAEREQQVRQEYADSIVQQQHAAEQAAMRHQAALEKLRLDFDEHAQRLGEFQIDQDRVFGSMSTPEKIGTILLVGLAGGKGGPENNAVLKALNQRVAADVEAQKFAYKAGMDHMSNRQTAFGMAMQQFHDEDAATAQARAAGLSYANARLGVMEAEWKGTEAANHADVMRGNIEAERQRLLADGIKFVPPSVAADRYKMLVRGQEIPGTLDAAGAQKVALEHGVKPAEAVDQEMVKMGGQATLEKIKQQGDIAKEQVKATTKGKDFEVRLPNGEVVTAPNEKETDTLRGIITSNAEVQRLVTEAKKIREDSAFRISVDGRNRLGRLQSKLVTQYGVQNKLGALSERDFELALNGTADLFQWGNGVEARLEGYSRDAMLSVADRIKTYTTGPERAPKTTGVMPGSSQYHGKDK